jgi:RNA polymerase sigma-70 factor (ECF subfamily)
MGGRFETTRWSLVLAARDRAAPGWQEALNALCAAYWYPLYAFARRSGLGPEEAEDVTQEFFARLLEKDTLDHVHPDKGRFRAFLLASYRNFMADEWRHAHTARRGGGAATVSFDVETAEGWYRREPSHDLTPEKIFERRWAMTLLERVLARLGEEQSALGRGAVFEKLKVHLPGALEATPYAAVARDLGMKEVTLKVAVHRLRRRFREILLEEIAHTVTSEEEIEAELRHLFSALDA